MTGAHRRDVLKGGTLAAAATLIGADALAQIPAGQGQPTMTGTPSTGNPAPPPTTSTPATGALLENHVCDSWDAIKDLQFDIVIVGGGTFGGYIADKLFRKTITLTPDKRPRILVLEQGPFLFSTHVQNIGRSLTRTFQASPFPPSSKDPFYPTSARDHLWTTPWDCNTNYLGYCPAIGGRSLFWSGWTPRLTDDDLQRWPTEIVQVLLNEKGAGGKVERASYANVEREIGASRPVGYITPTKINAAFHAALQHTTYKVRDSSGKFRILTQFDRAPLAVVASPPQPGLFPFSKFSSAAFLCNAVAQDKYNRLLPRELEKRRLFVVPNARVWKLGKQGAQVTEVFFDLNGKTTPTSVRLGSTGTVILANGTIEATRIALLDLELKNKTGIPKAENLMAHLRSNFAAKLPRTALKVFDSAFPDKPPAGEQELAAFIVRGDDQTRDRRFHFQIIVGSINPKDPNPPGENADDLVPQGPEDLMWQMVPDIELVDELMNGRDDNVIVVVRGVGEIGGVNTKIGKGTSRVEISSDAGTGDPRSIKNAKITMELNSEDLLLWKEMDLAAVELLRQIAGAHPVTFTNPKVFTSFPQTKQMIEQQSTENAPWRDPLGTTHHDAGTLFMGPPDKAVTDHTGKFHHMDNVFVAGPALFPSVGSANPVLTSLCLAHRTAEFIIRERFLRGDLFSQIVAFNRPDLAKQLQTSTLSEHFATLQGAGIPSALSMEAANIAKRLDEAEALEEANP